MSKEIKTSHGEPEVFVLPPNLLEKLGINLSNITQNAQQVQERKKKKKNKRYLKNGSDSNHDGTKSSVSEVKRKNEESSFLETADLMKKSVFLSPTFIPTVVNAIPGEVEIVNRGSAVNFIDSAEINTRITASDNNFNKGIKEKNVELETLPCTLLDSKQHESSKEIDTSVLCNGNGLLPKIKKKENVSTNGIHINNFNTDGTESISTKENQLTSLQHNKQSNSQMSKILCDSYANSDNMNYEISSDNIIQDLSLLSKPNKDNNNIADVVIDTVISNKKYFVINKSTIGIDEALIIPLSMTPEPTSYININDINGDAEDINIDVFQTLTEQESDELKIANKEQKQEICKFAEVAQSNDVNIDIIKYTECDDCSDMELENMLHETEILVPTTSTAEEIKSSRNEVINIIDKEVYRTNSQRDVTDENDLCNSIEENKILISILPELIDTSSLDIFCEHNMSNDIEMDNVNNHEKSDKSDSVDYIQYNQINMDTITNIEHIETRNKSDIELDNVLRETEILIPLPLPSESINNNTIKISHISEIENKSTCNEYEVLNEKEAEKEFIEAEVPLVLSNNSDVGEKDEKDKISENTMVVDNSATVWTDNSLEREDTSKIQNVNDEIMKSDQKNLLHIVSQDHVTQSLSQGNLSNDSCMELNLTSIISETEIKIIDNENKKVIKSLEQNIQKHNKDSSISESKNENLVLKNEHRCDRIQIMQAVQSNNVYFDTKVDRKYEINKSQKPEFAKSDKDKSENTLSMRKQIETNTFHDKAILQDQQKISNQLNIAPYASLQNDHVDNIKEDKVQEIAEYLKQVIQNKGKRKFYGKRGVKILKPNPGSLTKSKIFIQGVEKPGGSEEYEINFDTKKILTTYERKEKHVKSQLTPVIGTVLLKDVTRPEENYSEINTCIEQSLSTKRQEYCLCGDFGKLTFYDDYDSLYEHIHFGSNKSVNCPIDTVFEIYNDERNTIVNNTEERECTQDKNYNSENEDCHICWQKFEYQQYKLVRSEMQSNKQNECIENTDFNTDVSITKSNSPMIQMELETANISELETSKKDKDIADNNVVSSEVSDTLLTAVIVEDNYEITSSLSSNTSTPASHIHMESKEKEDNNKPCRTINESVEIEIDEGSQIDIESKAKGDRIQQYSCEDIDKTVAFEEDEVLYVDVRPKEKEANTEQQSCQIIDESVEDAAHTVSHVDILSTGKEDNKGEQSCEVVGESVIMAADGAIRENIGNETMDSNRDCVEDVQKSKNHLKSRKRKIKSDSEEAPPKKSDKCGVCQQVFAPSEWEDHISTVHCYIAWKDGQTLDFDNLLLLKKLKKKLKTDSKLKCSFCAFKNTNLEKFLSHVKKCVAEVSKSKIDKSKEPKEVAISSISGKTKCGVCHVDVDDENWIRHISDEHHYLAWKDGEPPLDTSDENEVKTHLLNLVKIYGHLICTKCGLLRKYTSKTIKSYLTHIKTCRNNNPNESRRSILKTEPSKKSDAPSTSAYKCAVCGEKVDASKWIDHIAQEHNYRAWKHGDVAPNLEDKDVLWEHLNEISKKAGGLHCSKCGVVRKYVKAFLQHIGPCTGNQEVDVSDSDKSERTIEHNTIESPETKTQLDAPISTSTPKTSRKKAKTSEKTSCGVCRETVEESAWIDHLGKEHNYLAWKDGEAPLDVNDREAVWQHLHNVVSIAGKLVCAKCGKSRKYPKVYLQHVSECQGPDTSVVDDSLKESNYSLLSHLDRSLKGQNLNSSAKGVKCGVCQEVVGRNAWIAHIQTAHGYIAWVDGETPLDSNNDDAVRHHLQQIVDEVGTLICPTCGSSLKYAKKFLQHVKQCTAEKKTVKNKGGTSQNIPPHELVECGACKQNVQINQWVNHLRTMHNYLAWKQGNLAIRSTAVAKKRLQTLLEKLGELNCPKCGYKGDSVDLYLQHAESCKGNLDIETEDNEVAKLAQEGLYQCALCSEKIKYGDWREHSLSKHYTVAWVVGDEPIDVFNQNEIAKIMKEYQQYGEFVCKVCGLSRSSGLGFFAHVISCGLKEEEADRFKITCEVCNAKCPGIYKSQHMAAHSQQELAKQRKVVAQEDREKEKQRKLDELTPTPGRRRAAERARMVIEETVSQFKHVCQSCAFGTDAEEDMAKHKCPKKRKMSGDLDMSLEQDESSDDEAFPDLEDESDEGEGDSKSDTKKRSDNSSTTKITRIPFVVSNVQDYVTKNLKDYTKTYLTTSTLFPEWRKCGCEAVTGVELREFMPPLEESCQVHASGSWRNYKRWEAVVEKQKTTVFTGASIQRICWLPALASEEPASHVLAVACHSGVDCPQYHVDDLPEHKSLIQFWDFGDFKTEPKLVFGLALQHGTVWAMDWCPSGAREAPPQDSDKGFVRMGLLAVACSNGMAYIYSVPYPSSVVVSDSIIHKLEPVAQLKFTMKSDRKVYQATSICWSQQKGHGTVIVGYGDGSTAYYDLNTESPFLKSQENNVTIFYPFYDEHTHNGSITDMDSFPMARASSAAGAVCVSSPTGSVLTSHGGAARCARVRSHLASSTAKFLPAWPSALLAGEDIVTNITPAELEYWGMGRRAGFLSTCCGCPHCALVATFMAPFLRIMRPHHARTDLKKQVIAWIGAKQLAKKRKHNEDKSANKMEEALTYEEVVAKYGIQFRLVDKEHNKDDNKKAMAQYKEVNPECFPIAEVPSMAFCSSAKHHRRLAVATHAGLIFVLNA